MQTIAVVAALLFATTSQSQQTSYSQGVNAPPPLVEKIDVSIVNIDVTVTDRRGQPVQGLTRNDFEVFEDGKPQPISNFYAVENAKGRSDVHPASSAPEAAPEQDRFRRKVLVLIDNANTTPHGRNIALDRLEAFVNEHFDDGRYDWSIATVDSRVHLMLPMTSDKKALHSVVAAIRRTGTRIALKAPIEHSEFQSISAMASTKKMDGFTNAGAPWASNQTINVFGDEVAQSEQTISAYSATDAIVEAARAFGSSEGRKLILLVTGYLPLASTSPNDRSSGYVPSGESPSEKDTGGMGFSGHTQEIVRTNRNLTVLRDIMVREANASNTSIYIVSAEGLELPAQETVNSMSGTPRTRSSAIDTSPMFWLAKQTGGAYLPGSRLDQSFVEFDRQSSAFYSLGFAPLRVDDDRYHRLTVNIKGHKGYRLQYRDGYTTAPTDQQMTRALRSPLGVAMQPSTMGVSLIFGQPKYSGIVALVPIKATMSMESLQYITDGRGSRTRLHVYVSIFDPDGRNITLAKSFADISILPNESATGPMTVTIPPLALAKGTYRVVVAVRDELTDHVGVTSQKIDI